jgi:RNA 2',3'-cyclic 3'-phosphodiesterase
MSRGATARLFVAVDPPLVVREALADWARDVAASLAPAAAGSPRAGMRWLDPALLHLTLCFLGARPVHEIAALAAALPECAEHPGELSVGMPLWLPPRRPRALAVEIHDRDGELRRLHQRACRALAGASGWEPERRRFRAHVTVARMRPGLRSHHDPALLAATPRLDFAPESLSLYRSWLTPTGAGYETIARCTLVPGG